MNIETTTFTVTTPVTLFVYRQGTTEEDRSALGLLLSLCVYLTDQWQAWFCF
jgi:hypothetical protein